MNNLLVNSAYFGIVLSLLAYYVGDVLKKKTKLAIFNPLLVSSVLIIIFLLVFDIDYSTFNEGAKYLTYLLTPATVCLALPLYRQFDILKENVSLIFISILSGCLTCFILIIGIDVLIHLDQTLFLSLLPKSITTAIAIGVTEEIGGISGITVAAVIITGILSSMIATTIFKMFHIKHPIAKGLALGTAGHAIGTSKAIELGEVEAAMSSLAIVVTGIMTVVLVPILVSFYY